MATKWHKGPPPSIGWWPASAMRDSTAYRWWDGTTWSLPARSWHDIETVERLSNYAVVLRASKQIEWTDRPADWPERSRT